MRARLPFPTTLFDFVDSSGVAPLMGFHLVDDDGQQLDFELRALLAGETAEDRRTVFVPIVGARDAPPEEIGAAFVDWDDDTSVSSAPARWRETMNVGGGRALELSFISVSAAMEAIGDVPRAVPGGLLGCLRHQQEYLGDRMRTQLATQTATAVRLGLKLLYLLDSANVGLERVHVSRQVRRQADRTGAEIAWTVVVRPSATHAGAAVPGGVEYSHRFEVRGNFAHHPQGSWLFERSPPEEIRACPRCGQCRRVWRPSHVKGPADRPLAIKIRRVDFVDNQE
jgi:hypothetical protein